MRRRVGILLALIVAGTVGWWRWNAVQQQKNSTSIRGSGIIEVTEVDVAFEVSGTVAERLVDEGAALDRGEPVARLDDREYRLQAERASAAKAAADARYRLLTKGSRAQDVERALAAVEAAETQLTMQQREYRRIQALHDSQVISKAEFDQATAVLATTQSARDQARAQLGMLQEGFRIEEIEEGRARLRETEKALELAELNLARCQLFAPTAGRVLSKNREAGETVPAGASIITIGDLSRPWLNLYISERDLGKVSLGMPAFVTVDSFPDEPFPGKVSFIAEKAEFTPKNIQTPDERVKLVYRVKIEMENRNGALKPGMPADGMIPLNHDHG